MIHNLLDLHTPPNTEKVYEYKIDFMQGYVNFEQAYDMINRVKLVILKNAGIWNMKENNKAN